MGTKVVKSVPTTTSTYKNKYPVRSTKGSQKKVTVTPKPSTQRTTTTVITVASTSLKPGTDVVEVVETKYETATITADTITRVSTVTTSTDTTILIPTTTTVAAPDTFRPILDTLEGARMRGGGVGAPFKRDAAAEELVERQPAKPGKHSLYSGVFGVHPQRVNCVITIKIAVVIVVTKTKPAVTITAPASTTTVTSTEIITSTSTIVPADVTVVTTSKTTSTIEETTTPEETMTTTMTTTNTVEAPGATAYAICGSRNYADSLASGGTFYGAEASPPTMELSTDIVGSAYECCERCAGLPNCVDSIFYEDFGGCVLRTPESPGDCSLENPCIGTVKWVGSPSPSSGIVSNGKGVQYSRVDAV